MHYTAFSWTLQIGTSMSFILIYFSKNYIHKGLPFSTSPPHGELGWLCGGKRKKAVTLGILKRPVVCWKVQPRPLGSNPPVETQWPGEGFAVLWSPGPVVRMTGSRPQKSKVWCWLCYWPDDLGQVLYPQVLQFFVILILQGSTFQSDHGPLTSES